MMTRTATITFVLCVAAIGGAAEKASGVLAMDVFAQAQTIDLLLFEETPSGKELRHRRSRDGAATWSAPVTIDRAERGIVAHHRGMDPQIAASGDTVVVLWTIPGTSQWGEGPLATATSRDGGRTWSAGPNPADDGSREGHSFLELVADSAGVFSAFWLDSRDGAQGLRLASSQDGGRSWSANLSIDTRTCECCWNKGVALAPGVFALLYRDKDPRDMALATSGDGGRTWTRTATVGSFEWALDGCPHVGGALAQTHRGVASRLHALVWTGAEGHEGLHWLASRDRGRTWSAPRRLGSPRAKHAALAGSQSRLAAVWDDRLDGARIVMGATSDDEGATWRAAERLSAADRVASHPLVVWSAGRFVAFWTDQDARGHTEWRSRPLAAQRPAETRHPAVQSGRSSVSRTPPVTFGANGAGKTTTTASPRASASRF